MKGDKKVYWFVKPQMLLTGWPAYLWVIETEHQNGPKHIILDEDGKAVLYNSFYSAPCLEIPPMWLQNELDNIAREYEKEVNFKCQ